MSTSPEMGLKLMRTSQKPGISFLVEFEAAYHEELCQLKKKHHMAYLIYNHKHAFYLHAIIIAYGA
jgi:hypothetical protein